MAGNLPILAMPTVPAADGGSVYLVKDGTDYKALVGQPGGLAFLGSDGLLPSAYVELNWVDIAGKPVTFTPSAHTHSAADITSGVLDPARVPAPTAIEWSIISGEPVYTTRWPAWSEVTGKPLTFTPTAHTHDAVDITSGVLDAARIPSIPWSQITSEPVYAQRWPTWNEVSSKPSAFTPISHTHPVSQITGLANSATLTASSSSVANTIAYRNSSANIYANDFVVSSDERLKEQIRDQAPRERLADLLRFTVFIMKESREEKLGLIAQEVQKVAPEYVSESPNGTLSIDKAGIALECVLGLAVRVRELESKL